MPLPLIWGRAPRPSLFNVSSEQYPNPPAGNHTLLTDAIARRSKHRLAVWSGVSDRASTLYVDTVDAPDDSEELLADVCSWHLADMPLALTNVCFEGNNGHDAYATRCLLMTQSGHSRVL